TVAVCQTDGPRAGLAALAELDPCLPRHTAVAAYLHECDGDLVTASRLYAEAARSAPNLSERDHLTRQAPRSNTRLRGLVLAPKRSGCPRAPPGLVFCLFLGFPAARIGSPSIPSKSYPQAQSRRVPWPPRTRSI